MNNEIINTNDMLQEYINYIKDEVLLKEAKVYEITNANDDKVNAFFYELFNRLYAKRLTEMSPSAIIFIPNSSFSAPPC